ncbi:accessory Sec system protein Asp3 [Facklamia sp. 7083-14-GEN3]|uniref:accessory Sec system protein Asp3 n=1 Tax=Facklamia sp. 7083-14-GEN3 TaxID=2973478 RepID=UPI00215C9970|nr:accessory Sec system protein Asp3 [Facklamia sp. 7083-14-GEN3]MCR8968376.1 accessory Sec system protein Asp3 [Facklamia sp. 7083-14-GEN3]
MQSHKIFWGPLQPETFMYGSVIKKKSNHGILFNNSDLPSGTIIHQWSSKSDYFVYKEVPLLPQLQTNQSYCLKIIGQPTPAGTTYIRIKFFGPMDKLIDQIYSNDLEVLFKFPTGTIHYKIELIYAGFKSFDFDYLYLTNQELDANQVNVFEYKNLSQSLLDGREIVAKTKRPLKIIFEEPYFRKQSLYYDFQAQNACLIKSPARTLEEYLNDPYINWIGKILNRLQKNQLAIELVGYGPISNFVALYFANRYSTKTVWLNSYMLNKQSYQRMLVEKTAIDVEEIFSLDNLRTKNYQEDMQITENWKILSYYIDFSKTLDELLKKVSD